MIRRYASGFRFLLMLADGVGAVVALIGVSIWRFGSDWESLWLMVVPQPLGFLLVYAVGWVVVLTVNGLYRPRARWSIRTEAAAIARATAMMALATLSVLFIFKLPDVSRLFLLSLFPVQFALTLASRVALRAGFSWLRRRGRNLRHVLILGAGARGQAFAAKLEDHRELGLRIEGFLDDDEFELARGWRYLGPLESLEDVLHAKIIDEVAICLPFSQWAKIDTIARLCEEEGKIVRIPVDMLERAISAGRVEDLDGTPVYSLVSGPDRALALAFKRFVDIAVATMGLMVLSPIFVVIAAAIALDGGRPVIFSQTRVGLHGRPFRVLKFRSMGHDAETRRAELSARNEMSGPVFKVTDDPRVTPVGRFLRRSSLDELPQLWNVLRGQMSLVGPRPPLPDEVAGYDLWHRRRLSMKPGITGLWQVRGRRGRDPDFDRWVAADLEYIDRWSLWLDLKILARTIPAALEGR